MPLDGPRRMDSFPGGGGAAARPVATGPRLIFVGKNYGLGPIRIGCAVSFGVFLSLLVAAIPPVAIAVVLIQVGTGRGGDWLFVWFFLRRAVVRASVEAFRRSFPDRVSQNVQPLGVDWHRHGTSPPTGAVGEKEFLEQLQRLEDAVADRSPMVHCGGEMACDYARQSLEKNRNANESNGKIAQAIPDDFFQNVTDKNLATVDFYEKLIKIQNFGRLALLADVGRAPLLVRAPGEALPSAGNDFYAALPSLQPGEDRGESARREWINRLVRKIYKAYPDDGQRLSCLKTLLAGPYAQGTGALPLSEWVAARAGQGTPAHLPWNFTWSSVQFCLNADGSVTVRGHCYCAPADGTPMGSELTSVSEPDKEDRGETGEFSKKSAGDRSGPEGYMQETYLANGKSYRPPQGPFFVWSCVEYTVTDPTGAVKITHAEFAHRMGSVEGLG